MVEYLTTVKQILSRNTVHWDKDKICFGIKYQHDERSTTRNKDIIYRTIDSCITRVFL